MGVVDEQTSQPNRHGSLIFVVSQTFDEMKRFCANDVLLSVSTFFLPTDLVVFWGNRSLSKSSLSIPVPSELLSAFICRNKEPIFCSPLLRLPPDDTRTTVAKRKKTSFFRLQHNKASNYSKLLAILIKTRYINWSSTTKDKCINANLMAPVFFQVCLNKEN